MASIEVNIVKENNVIDTVNIELDDSIIKKQKINVDGNEYNINNKSLYLYMKKKTYKPCVFYEYGKHDPIEFDHVNKSIPARALHLLWNHGLYRVLVQLDKDRTNLIVIVVLIISIALYGLRIYFKLG